MKNEILFFFIGNKTFIEKKNWTSCSRWWTLWTMKTMKQIQEDQEIKEIETKKSSIAVQFIHPQIWAQRNRVPKRRDFRWSNVLSFSSKVWVLCFCQTNHIKHAGTIFQMVERCLPNQFLHIKKKELTDLGITHGSQTLQKLCSIRHEKTYNEEGGDPLISHHSSINNTY